jgi:hypothetical protein
VQVVSWFGFVIVGGLRGAKPGVGAGTQRTGWNEGRLPVMAGNGEAADRAGVLSARKPEESAWLEGCGDLSRRTMASGELWRGGCGGGLAALNGPITAGVTVQRFGQDTDEWSSSSGKREIQTVTWRQRSHSVIVRLKFTVRYHAVAMS